MEQVSQGVFLWIAQLTQLYEKLSSEISQDLARLSESCY